MPVSRMPKGWPDGVVFLTKLVYSRKIQPEAKMTLQTLPPGSVVVQNSSPSTCSAVRITAISDPSHPACSQHGLFAIQHIRPDSFILFYLGYVHDKHDTNPSSDYDLSLDREFGVGVDAGIMGNEARFINDYRGIADKPNAEFRDVWVEISKGLVEKRIAVYALPAGKSGKNIKGIAKGNEILVSYGKGFWSERRSQETAR